MRAQRRNVVLAVVLAVLVVLDLLLGSEGGAVGGGAAPFPDLDADRAARIEITDAARTVVLERSGERWTVAARDGFPAEQGAVTELLRRLAALGGPDRVAREKSSHALFGLDENAARLRVRDDAGGTLAELSMGRPEDEAAGSYVAAAGAADVYRASTVPVAVADPLRWIASDLVDLPRAEVRVVRVELGDGRAVSLSRREDGRWGVPDRPELLVPKDVDPLLLVADLLVVDDVLAEGKELTPELTLAFQLEGGRERRLVLGGEVEGGRAMTRPEWPRPWVVRVSSRSAANLLGATEGIFRALDR